MTTQLSREVRGPVQAQAVQFQVQRHQAGIGCRRSAHEQQDRSNPGRDLAGEFCPAGEDCARVGFGVQRGIRALRASEQILRDQLHVKGLTTAASLWVSASLGVAAGLGAYRVGFVVTGLTVVVLVLARPVGGWLTRGRQRQELAIDLAPNVEVGVVRAEVEQIVGPFLVSVVDVSHIPVPVAASGRSPVGIALVGVVRLPATADIVEFSSRLRALEGVLAVRLTQ